MKENISHRSLQATRAGLLSIFASRQKSLLTLAIIFAASFTVETICAAEPVIGILPKTIIGDVFMKNMSDAAVAKGKALGAKVEVYSVSSHEAVEKQVSAVEELLSPYGHAFLLGALGSEGSVPGGGKDDPARN